MIIQLVDKNQGLVDLWDVYFKNIDHVITRCGDFFSLETDCVVSPANSFGFMDGGLDYVISSKVGWTTQRKLQDEIITNFNGELLVGQAALIETENEEIPYCISAPTMRVPDVITGTPNAYLAAKAIFRLLIENTHKINKVTISGLGTGVGQLSYESCAKQMRVAYNDVLDGVSTFPKSWKEAQQKHIKIINA